MTLNQLIRSLLEIAGGHKMVRTAKHLQPEDFIAYNYKDVEYPAVWFTLNNSTVSGKELFTSFVVTVADMHHPEDMSEVEIQSDMQGIALDLLAQLSWDKHEWKLERETSFEFFREDKEDVLAGVTFQINLKLPFIYDNCQVPTNYELPNGNFVYINTNRFMTVADFIVGEGEPMEDGGTTYQNNLLTIPPFVFIGGQLLTYKTRTDRRYVTHNATTKTITINNGGVLADEHVYIII